MGNPNVPLISPVAVDPAIRATPRSAAPDPVRDRSSEIRKLKALEYADYLQTDHWRRVRNQALARAGHRCSRCDGKRELQVHHTTYANKGDEQPGDLEVLCRTCHEGHHFEESRTKHLGIYIKLVSEVVKLDEERASLSDVMEAVKGACARAKVPYDSQRVGDALEIVYANRHGFTRPLVNRRVEAKPDPRPISHGEAREILKRLGMPVPVREIKRALWCDVDGDYEQARRRAELDTEVY